MRKVKQLGFLVVNKQQPKPKRGGEVQRSDSATNLSGQAQSGGSRGGRRVADGESPSTRVSEQQRPTGEPRRKHRDVDR